MTDSKPTPPAAERDPQPSPRPAYAPPRITKKRAVSRATLFTGSGPDSGGVVGNGG
jgi:hypothetical protein